MRYLMLLLIIITGFFSCRQSTSQKDRIKITQFKGLPPQIEGCSCYFSKSESDFKRDRYVFASGGDSTAYISINKKPVVLKLVSVSGSSGFAEGKGFEKTFSNGIYSVRIKLSSEEKTGDEVWWYTGKLQLSFKGVEVKEFSILGECGC